MTLQSPMRPDGFVRRQAPFGSWTTAWTDGPPSDWDEIRDRLRSLHAPKPERRREVPRGAAPDVIVRPVQPAAVAGLAIEAPHCQQQATVSWRRADAPAAASPLASLAPLRSLLASLPVARWWREHDPLLVQRLLLLIGALLLVLLILQFS